MGYALALLLIGRFVSVFGYKRTVVLGFAGIGLVLLCLQWAQSYFSLHLLFFFLAFSAGTYIPSILSIITETYDYRHWGKAIGIHDSAASLAIFSMPILVTIGLHFFPWRRLLLFLGFACLILPFFFWRVSREPRQDPTKERVRYIDFFKSRTTWIMGLFWMVSAASNLGVYSILPLYLIKERGMDFALANTLFGISRVCGLFVSILTGFLTDRYGYRRMIKWSIVTTGLSTVGLALSSNLTEILISLILQATLSLAFFPVGLAAVSKLTPLSERSLAIGVIAAIGGGLGSGGSPFILGVVADHFSFQIGIFWLGVFTTLSALAVRLLKEAPLTNRPSV
jgi:NNP family nitrate/nitrite transporter-like MFS transporter